MSAIGRVFIVLNLVLAGAFVGFAGTFLQRHTDYKQRYEDTNTKLEEANKSHLATLQAKEDELRNAIRELDSTKREFDNAQAENKALKTDNDRLQAQLADLATDVKTLSSHTTEMATTIETANKQSNDAYNKMLEAENAKNEAASAREDALQNLSEAKRQIAQLEGQLADANGQLSDAKDSNQEQALQLAYYRQKFPGALQTATPELHGVVHTVTPGGKLVTVRVTDNPGNVEIKPGWSLALYDEHNYKGEAVIENVNGDYAFCKVTNTKDGESIQAGDRAATHIGE